MTAKRIDDFDFIKGCLILFVVWGHFCMYLSGTDYEKNLFTTYIRLFQMPLFIFISGFFQKPVFGRIQAVKKVLKSIKHIAIPMVSWTVLVYVAKLLLNKSNYNGLGYFIEQTHGIVSLFWYLGCLLMCLFLYTAISLCQNLNKLLGYFFFLVSIFMMTMVNVKIFHFSFLWIFFCLGLYTKYVLNNTSLLKQIPKWIEIIVVIILMITVLLLGYQYETCWTFYNADNCVFTHDSGWNSEILFVVYRYFIYIATTFCSFYLLKKLYSVIKNTRIAAVIVSLGKETLFIYVSHVAFLSLFAHPVIVLITADNVVMQDSPIIRYYLICTICTIVLVVILFFISTLIKKHIPSISKFLLGNS